MIQKSKYTGRHDNATAITTLSARLLRYERLNKHDYINSIGRALFNHDSSGVQLQRNPELIEESPRYRNITCTRGKIYVQTSSSPEDTEKEISNPPVSKNKKFRARD